MGTCISKCLTASAAAVEDCNPFEDKLVIAQASSSRLPSFNSNPLSKDLYNSTSRSPSLFSSSPTISTTTTLTTCPSLTTTTSSSTSTATFSTTSCSSPCLSKDRSISNDFLRSCIKENPQVVGAVDQQVEKSPTKKVVITKNCSISSAQSGSRRSKLNHESPKKAVAQCARPQPPKKANEKSPSLARQTSLIKQEQEKNRPSAPVHNRNSCSVSPLRRLDHLGTKEFACKRSPSRRFNGSSAKNLSKNPQEEGQICRTAWRGLSPSPSKRFDFDACGDVSSSSQEQACKRAAVSSCRGLSRSLSRKFSADSHLALLRNSPKEHCKRGVGVSSSNGSLSVAAAERVSKENTLPVTVSASLSKATSCGLKKRELCTLSSQVQVEQNVVGGMLSNNDTNSCLSVEDIENPLISLDCFIFL